MSYEYLFISTSHLSVHIAVIMVSKARHKDSFGFITETEGGG